MDLLRKQSLQQNKGEEYYQKYSDLKHQLQYEKKINETIVTTLENKVSELIAEVETLKSDNYVLKSSNSDYELQNQELSQLVVKQRQILAKLKKEYEQVELQNAELLASKVDIVDYQKL